MKLLLLLVLLHIYIYIQYSYIYVVVYTIWDQLIQLYIRYFTNIHINYGGVQKVLIAGLPQRFCHLHGLRRQAHGFADGLAEGRVEWATGKFMGSMEVEWDFMGFHGILWDSMGFDGEPDPVVYCTVISIG